MELPFKVTPFMEDTAERAGKSAIQGFAVGSAIDLSGAAFSVADIDWANGFNFGMGMLIASVVTSLLSYKRNGGKGGDGTASLVKAVGYRELDETNGTVA